MFYYFRVSTLKENDANLIYPLDSNIANICLPEKDLNKEDNYYYCYFLLSNIFNEFYIDFYVSTANHKDNYKLYTFRSNEKIKYNIIHRYYKSDENDKNLKFILFKFEFNDNEIKTILSTFSNQLNLIYPQIYSSQIYRFYKSINVLRALNIKFQDFPLLCDKLEKYKIIKYSNLN